MYTVACRVCLATRCRLLPLRAIAEAYCEVTGLACHPADGLPQSVCVECAALVGKCRRLRGRSRCADGVLRQILGQHNVITQKDVENIDRGHLKLVSNLVTKHYPPGYYDTDLTYTENEPTTYEPDVKDENILNDIGFNLLINDDSNLYIEDTDPISAIDCPLKVESKDDINSKIAELNPTKASSDSDDDKPLRQRFKKKKVKTKETAGPSIKDHFVIKKLDVEEQKIELEKRKSSVNYLRSKYRCECCYRGFQEQRTFDEHMMKHNKDVGPYCCAVCSRYFASTYLLRRHRGDHETLYSCKQCPFTTHFLHYTKLHVNWHRGTTYACSQCSDVFKRHSSLLTHRRIKHPSEHVCAYCGYSFLGEKGIYQHQRLRHKGEDGELPCDAPHCAECDIRFASDSALRTHARVSPRHAPPDRLVRNVRPQGKVKRVKKERGDLQKPLQCEQCHMPMKTYSAYRFHFQREHPNMTLARTKPCEHLCDVCGKQFSCAANLADHQTEHLDSCLFECTACDKRYKRLSSLKLHQKVHSGRRHACPVCGKTFNQPTNRDRHLAQVHSDEKNVACLLCDKRFKSHGERKNHTQHVHLDKPWPRRRRQAAAKRRQEDYIMGTSAVDPALLAPMQ